MWKTPAGCIAVLLMLLITGCSSSGTMNIRQKMSQSIVPGKSVAVAVEITPSRQTDPDCQEVQTRLRERLFGRLLSEGIFKTVVRAPEPADYRLDVMITDARKVSGASRVMLGMMAGANFAEVDVRLLGQSNELITYYSVNGESAVHPLATEVSLDDAVREAVNNLVQGLKQ